MSKILIGSGGFGNVFKGTVAPPTGDGVDVAPPTGRAVDVAVKVTCEEYFYYPEYAGIQST